MKKKEFKLDQQTYAPLVDAGSKLAVAVRVFPSDLLLVGVREIRKVCQENALQGEPVAATASICESTREKRELLEEIAVALTAARIKIENAMNRYVEAAREMTGEKAAQSGLIVPKDSGRVTLT